MEPAICVGDPHGRHAWKMRQVGGNQIPVPVRFGEDDDLRLVHRWIIEGAGCDA